MPALDGLRALAVIAVILYHARISPDDASLATRAYEWVAIAGWVGVDLFFVLSGFLITGILLDAKGRPRFFRNFYLRRTLRIFPLYYAVLVAALLVGPHVFGTDDPGVRRILHEQGWLWTYTTNVEVLRAGEKLFSSDWLSLTHLWSLAIEEQFYLVWPLLVFVLPRRGLVAVAAAIVVGAPLLRAAMLHAGTPALAVYQFTPCRLDTLAVGSLCAVLIRARPAVVDRAAMGMLAAGAVGLVIVIGVTHRFDAEAAAVQIVGLSFLAICFGGVVLRAARGVRWLAHPALTTVGRYSYGIYIFHGLLLPFYRRVFLAAPTLAGALAYTAGVFVASTAIAAASWHLFERRFLALKERVAAVDSAPPAA